MYLYDKSNKEVTTMRQKIGILIVTALEICGIAGLTGFAINAECKRHKAEKAKSKAECECAVYKFCDYINSIKIRDLEKELKELKAKEKA